MKVVQVNTICGSGSIGRICVDLYEVLKKHGDEPYIAAGRGMLPPGIKGRIIGNKFDFYLHVMKNFTQGKAGFGSKKVTAEFIGWLRDIKPDIIHLHNIHGFYLQIEDLFSYLRQAGIPVIWTLHDCWPMTGHCAYFDYAGCNKWKSGCHDCELHAKAYPYAVFKDNSKWNYFAKKRAFQKIPNLTIVTPSNWLAGLVKESFLSEYPVEVIPNGIDLSRFTPLSKEKNREKSKTGDGSVHYTVLGVANRWEERKGFLYFEELAKLLPDRYTIELVGTDAAQSARIRKKYPDGKLIAIGRTPNVEMLSALYRSADVYVNATLEDNFPTTNLEALACGTPVITFETGGSPESVSPECGLVVPKGDVDKLFSAVCHVCENRPFDVRACRTQAEQYDREKRYLQYIDLYERKLKDGKKVQ